MCAAWVRACVWLLEHGPALVQVFVLLRLGNLRRREHREAGGGGAADAWAPRRRRRVAVLLLLRDGGGEVGRLGPWLRWAALGRQLRPLVRFAALAALAGGAGVRKLAADQRPDLGRPRVLHLPRLPLRVRRRQPDPRPHARLQVVGSFGPVSLAVEGAGQVLLVARAGLGVLGVVPERLQPRLRGDPRLRGRQPRGELVDVVRVGTGGSAPAEVAVERVVEARGGG